MPDRRRQLAARPRLQQYEALFRENDIDAEVLSDLTDGDLEKIGVSLGHRKRLLKAVAALSLGVTSVQSGTTAGERVAQGVDPEVEFGGFRAQAIELAFVLGGRGSRSPTPEELAAPSDDV